MKRIAIIGAGISGLTTARLLTESDLAEVTVFEENTKPGGLIRCDRIGGSLFHSCGGHIFNTHDEEVLKWFWQHFSKEEEFLKADRHSVIVLPDGQYIPYPIENFAYLLKEPLQRAFIRDMMTSADATTSPADNFEDFLLQRFGKTLYDLYFEPYNRKVWQCDLKDVPLSWLEGKLPMPSKEEIIYNNFNRVAEKQFVHSTFYYEKTGGSQFIADRLAEGLNIHYGTSVSSVVYTGKTWQLNGGSYDAVVFCGNIKDIPAMVKGVDGTAAYADHIDKLKYHGTTTVFCEIDRNPYSWVYLPDKRYMPHRIICTGNFSPTNNSVDLAGMDAGINRQRITASVEFTGQAGLDDILCNLVHVPLHPTYITHKYNKYTYPVQDKHTRQMIASLKALLAEKGMFLTGRFAEWEYYNMDAAMRAAMNTVKLLL